MSDDDDNAIGFRRLIRDAKEEAYHARRALRRELPDPSDQTKRDVAAALSDYRDALVDYRGENSLVTPWEERAVNVDEIDAMLSETIEREERLDRRGSAARTVEVPLVSIVPPNHLFAIGKELDAIAKELGFAAPAKQQTPNTEASREDLTGILKARGQDDALANLPESWVAEEDR